MIFEGVDNAEQYAVTAQGAGRRQPSPPRSTATQTSPDSHRERRTLHGLPPGTPPGRARRPQPSPPSRTPPRACCPRHLAHRAGGGRLLRGLLRQGRGRHHELRWGTESGNYTDTVAFATEGGVKISGRPGGETYYYQLRSLSAARPAPGARRSPSQPRLPGRRGRYPWSGARRRGRTPSA